MNLSSEHNYYYFEQLPISIATALSHLYTNLRPPLQLNVFTIANHMKFSSRLPPASAPYKCIIVILFVVIEKGELGESFYAESITSCDYVMEVCV